MAPQQERVREVFAAAPASGKKKKKAEEEEVEEEEHAEEEEEEEAPKVGRAMRDGRHPGGKRWAGCMSRGWGGRRCAGACLPSKSDQPIARSSPALKAEEEAEEGSRRQEGRQARREGGG